MRVELRGAFSNHVTTAQLEGPVQPGGRYSRWSDLALSGEPYRQFGEMTLWQGQELLAERRSFLW